MSNIKVGGGTASEANWKGQAWLVLFAAILAQIMIVGSSIYSFGIWSIVYLQEFKAPRASIMLCISLAIALEGFISPFVGRSLDRISIRHNLLVGMSLVALGMIASGFAHTLPLVILAWTVLIGAGGSFGGVLMGQTLASKWFANRSNRGLAVGLTLSGPALGAILLPIIIPQLFLLIGWRMTQIALGIAIIVIVLPLCFFVISDAPVTGSAEHVRKQAQVRAAASSFSTRQIVTDRIYLLTILAFFPILFVYTGLNHSIGLIANDAGMSTVAAGKIVAVGGVGTTLGKILLGAATDRVPPKILFWVPLGTVFLSVMFLNIGATAFPLGAASFCLGLTIGGYFPLVGAIGVARFSASSIGSFLGLISFFIPLATLAPILIGHLRDAVGNYMAGYLLCLAVLIVSTIGGILLSRARLELRQPANRDMKELASVNPVNL